MICEEKNSRKLKKLKVKLLKSSINRKRMYKSKNVIKKLLLVPNHKNFSRVEVKGGRKVSASKAFLLICKK
jgi:hypothetical protein